MSSGALIILLVLVLAVAGVCFYYGFKLGVRAERTNWDLRRMIMGGEVKVQATESMSELEVLINEQLGFWKGEPDDVDSEFCENYMNTINSLKDHIIELRDKSKAKWNRVKPVWDRMDYDKVTMATCIEYEINRKSVMDNLKALLGSLNRNARTTKRWVG